MNRRLKKKLYKGHSYKDDCKRKKMQKKKIASGDVAYLNSQGKQVRKWKDKEKSIAQRLKNTGSVRNIIIDEMSEEKKRSQRKLF